MSTVQTATSAHQGCDSSSDIDIENRPVEYFSRNSYFFPLILKRLSNLSLYKVFLPLVCTDIDV